MAKYNTRILVVGTTRDYIDHIRDRMQGKAIFLTDPTAVASLTPPVPETEEIVCALWDLKAVRDSLTSFLRQHRLSLSGITCFDCESLYTAAAIADEWNLPFPSTQAVLRCRDKLVSKQLWASSGISCPRVAQVSSPGDIRDFMKKTGGSVVLKPRSGSGSELTFRCDSQDMAEPCYRILLKRLRERAADPLFSLPTREGAPVISEEFIPGEEYSCDLFFDGKHSTLLRLAKKYFLKELPIGTAVAYEIPAQFPSTLSREGFLKQLEKAAVSLGLSASLCMADLMIRNGQSCILELSTRLGGDCLPSMIEASCGVDMLRVAMEFAEGTVPDLPEEPAWNRVIGVRFHAKQTGVLQAITPALQEWKANIHAQLWLHKPGDKIDLPPRDYGSWLLGQVIFSPKPDLEIAKQIEVLLQSVKVDIC